MKWHNNESAAMFEFLAPYAIVGAAMLAAIVAAFFRGRKSKATEAKLEKAEAELETRKRIDEATVAPDAASARDWLRARGKRDGDL